MITKEKLKARAIKALYNTDEIDDKFVEKALNDAVELSKGKNALDHFMEDYAYIRLKIYLKIELSEEDELLYKEALKAIEKADFIDEESGETRSAHFIKVATKQGVIL